MVQSPRGKGKCSRCGAEYFGFVGQTIECDCYKKCPSCGTLMEPFNQTPTLTFYQGEFSVLFECPKCHARSKQAAVEVLIT